MHRIFAAILVVGLLVAPLQVRAAPVPGPNAVDLSLKDMGIGWVLKSSATIDNSADAKSNNLTLAKEVQSGRLTGHESIFQRVPPGKYKIAIVLGLLILSSAVDLYDSPADARIAYQQALKQVVALPGTVLKPLRLAAVGQTHSAWTAIKTSKDGTPIFLDVLVFYRGPYVIEFVGDCQGLNNTTEVLELARTIDNRIQRASH